MVIFIDHVGDERYKLSDLGVSPEGYRRPEISVSRTFFRGHVDDYYGEAFWKTIENLFSGGFQMNISDDNYCKLRAKQGEQNKTTVVSVGCASGEEPISIALCAYDTQLWMEKQEDDDKFAPGMDVKIIGIDIAPENIELARRGRYPINAPRDVEEMFLDTLPVRYRQYFKKGEDGKWEVCPEVSRMVEFVHGDVRSLDLRQYDPTLIVCRYVLDDFTEQAAKELRKKLKVSAPAILIS